MKYHVARGETRLGAWSPEELAARYNAGELQDTDLIWRNGMSAWISFGQWLASEEGRKFDATARSGGSFEAPPSLGAPVPPMNPAAGGSFSSAPIPKPSNYLVQSILVTLFCCLPLGVVSIVFAAQVDSKYAGGDYAGAQKASDNAKLWCWVAFGVGLISILGYGAFGLIVGFSEAAHAY